MLNRNEMFLVSPDLFDAACGVFSGPLVCDEHEFDLIASLQDVVVLHFGHVEEQLLTLVNLEAQESELA